MVHSNFKRDGTDPELSRGVILPGLPGGPSWPAYVVSRAREAEEFVRSALGMTKAPEQPEDHLRYRKQRKPAQRPARRSNMLHISRRVRRKHRRAAK